jgi:hypothetical protein
MYQRWATKFDTLVSEIAGLANHLRDEARKAAQPEAAQSQEQIPAPLTSPDIEGEMAAAFGKKFSPKADGGQHPNNGGTQ